MEPAQALDEGSAPSAQRIPPERVSAAGEQAHALVRRGRFHEGGNDTARKSYETLSGRRQFYATFIRFAAQLVRNKPISRTFSGYAIGAGCPATSTRYRAPSRRSRPPRPAPPPPRSGGAAKERRCSQGAAVPCGCRRPAPVDGTVTTADADWSRPRPEGTARISASSPTVASRLAPLPQVSTSAVRRLSCRQDGDQRLLLHEWDVPLVPLRQGFSPSAAVVARAAVR
jgi:hypothetical protein